MSSLSQSVGPVGRLFLTTKPCKSRGMPPGLFCVVSRHAPPPAPVPGQVGQVTSATELLVFTDETVARECASDFMLFARLSVDEAQAEAVRSAYKEKAWLLLEGLGGRSMSAIHTDWRRAGVEC